MERCPLADPSLSKVFKNREFMLQVFAFTTASAAIHAIVARVIGSESLLKPALIGGTAVVSGYFLSGADHAYYRNDDLSHSPFHTRLRIIGNLAIMVLFTRYLGSTSYYWPMGTVLVMAYLNQFDQNRGR